MSGSTSVNVLIHDQQLLCANIGDSRAIIARQNSNQQWYVQPLSFDHKPSNPLEAERIFKAGGRVESFRDY